MIINKSRYKPFDVDVELGCADCKIVASNKDGTYQMLVFDGCNADAADGGWRIRR